MHDDLSPSQVPHDRNRTVRMVEPGRTATMHSSITAAFSSSTLTRTSATWPTATGWNSSQVASRARWAAEKRACSSGAAPPWRKPVQLSRHRTPATGNPRVVIDAACGGRVMTPSTTDSASLRRNPPCRSPTGSRSMPCRRRPSARSRRCLPSNWLCCSKKPRKSSRRRSVSKTGSIAGSTSNTAITRLLCAAARARIPAR